VGWLLVLGLKEGLVECATVCVKSWVILSEHVLSMLGLQFSCTLLVISLGFIRAFAFFFFSSLATLDVL
jgi:hypothetical protein